MGPVAVEQDGVRACPAGGRILGYDLARSLALLGMFIVHFGLVMSADQTRPAGAAWLLRLLDGRAAAIFIVLAGVGLTLRSSRAMAADDPLAASRVRRSLILRGLFLLVVGFVNLLIWPGDILRVYGVSLLLASGLISASDRRLLFIAAGFALGFVLLLLTLDYEKNWEWSTMTYHRLWTPEGVVRNLFFDGFRSVLPWTGLLVFGMWLGRRDLRDRATNTRTVLIAACVAVLGEWISRLCLSYFRAHPQGMDAGTIVALFGTESMPPLPLFLMSSGGTAVVVIGLSVRVAEALPSGPWLRPLAAVGQMALTWYLGHIIVGLGAVEASGRAASEPLPVAEGCGAVFFAVAVFTSWLWKRRFRQGPLEWVMRVVAG